MEPVKAVIFDIDGTLSEKNSWHVLAIAMGATPAEDLEVVELQQAGKITNREADARILAFWKRKGLATRENFRKTFEDIPLRQDAQDLVNYLKQKKILICLITGSMDMYAEVVARRLGVEDFYSNAKLSWSDDGNISDFTYDGKQGTKKLDQFHEFIKKNNLKAAECAAIGDSENDYLLFLETKKGIAVRSESEDKVLEAAAWKIVNNLKQIKEIL